MEDSKGLQKEAQEQSNKKLKAEKIKSKKEPKETKQKVKAAKGSKQGRKRSIRNTLMGAFAIPVVLMVVFGAVSYNIASTTVTDKSRESYFSTVEAVGDYMQLVATTLENKALELTTNNSVKDYYAIYYKNSGVFRFSFDIKSYSS